MMENHVLLSVDNAVAHYGKTVRILDLYWREIIAHVK